MNVFLPTCGHHHVNLHWRIILYELISEVIMLLLLTLEAFGDIPCRYARA
jgi:hypothetical protein